MNLPHPLLVLLAAVLSALAAGCAHRPPAGLARDPHALLDQVRAAQEKVQRVRGTAKVRIASPGLNGTVLEAITAEKPDRVRLETLDFFGNPAAVLVAAGGRFSFLDAREGVLYRGEATPENVSRLLPVVLPVEELVTILCGSAPLLAGDPLEAEEEGAYLKLTLGRAELGQQLTVAGGAAVVRSRVRRDAGQAAETENPAYDLDFERFAGRDGVRFPHEVRLDAPAGRAGVSLLWQVDLEVNPALDPRLFELPAPRGARVVELERGQGLPPAERAPGE